MSETNDDDLCIPRSAMYKLVKELVPQVRLSGEAKDLIVTCCNEFIHLLAAEANNVCEKQSKKLILPDHVLLALDNLGFSEYKQDCLEVMKQMQEETDKRKKLSNKLKNSGIPEEELLRQQSELFAEARKQQELLENADEWSKVQQAAQEALQRQTSLASSTTSPTINLFNTNSNNNNNYYVFPTTNNDAAINNLTNSTSSSTSTNNNNNNNNIIIENTIKNNINHQFSNVDDDNVDDNNCNNNDDDDDNYD